MPIEKIIVLEDDVIIRKSPRTQLLQRVTTWPRQHHRGAQELLGRDTFDLIFPGRAPSPEAKTISPPVAGPPAKRSPSRTGGSGNRQSVASYVYIIPFFLDQMLAQKGGGITHWSRSPGF